MFRNLGFGLSGLGLNAFMSLMVSGSRVLQGSAVVGRGGAVLRDNGCGGSGASMPENTR